MDSISRRSYVAAAVMAMLRPGLADGQITPTTTLMSVPTSTPPGAITLSPTLTGAPTAPFAPFATPAPVGVPAGTTGSLIAFVALICAIAWLALYSTRTR